MDWLKKLFFRVFFCSCYINLPQVICSHFAILLRDSFSLKSKFFSDQLQNKFFDFDFAWVLKLSKWDEKTEIGKCRITHRLDFVVKKMIDLLIDIFEVLLLSTYCLEAIPWFLHCLNDVRHFDCKQRRTCFRCWSRGRYRSNRNIHCCNGTMVIWFGHMFFFSSFLSWKKFLNVKTLCVCWWWWWWHRSIATATATATATDQKAQRSMSARLVST